MTTSPAWALGYLIYKEDDGDEDREPDVEDYRMIADNAVRQMSMTLPHDVGDSRKDTCHQHLSEGGF